MQIVFSYVFAFSVLKYKRKSAEYTECLQHLYFNIVQCIQRAKSTGFIKNHWELLQNKIVIVSFMDAHNCVSFKMIKYL